MKNSQVILCLALFFASTNLCLGQFDPEQESNEVQTSRRQEKKSSENVLTGKWQEYKRTTPSKRKAAEIEFKDTLQLEFMPDSTVRIWSSSGSFFSEPYEFSRKGLKFGDRYFFNLYEANSEQLNLGDENEVRHFKKVSKLIQQGIAKKIPGVEKGNISTSSEFLVGKWSVYKKEDKNYNPKNFYLKELEIAEQMGENEYKIISLSNNIAKIEKKEGSLKIEDNLMILSLEEETQEYEILKAEGAEITLRRDGYVLFLKNFLR